MITIKRELQKLIMKKFRPNKVIVVTGARRVGKTFLLKEMITELKKDYIFLNGEDINTHLLLEKRSAENYRNFLGSKKILIIDEAQKIPEIGSILKLMVDEIKGIQIIVTGSAAFDLSNSTGEPLVGRMHSIILYPLSVREQAQAEKLLIRPDRMEHRLIYGNYPELLHIRDNKSKQEYLNEIISSYLFRDILSFENIRNSSKVFNLLRLIAFQTGSQVSFHELGQQLGISKNTVERYLDLLSKKGNYQEQQMVFL
jgi:predicted AAA+ superfamily ATPase